VKSRSRLAFAVGLAVVAPLIPRPALSWTVPGTLADVAHLGRVDGRSAIVSPDVGIDHLGVSWRVGNHPRVRFRADGAWGPWMVAHQDGLPSTDGRTSSGLLPGGGADAFQVRGEAAGVRAVAINTTDGPRSIVWRQPEARASHLAQPNPVSRAEWGADESYRFRTDGTEKWKPTFYSTKKLIVHHTVTQNADPDPAGTVRAIYRYHAIDRGYGDIAYNFLVDEQGRVYKGRYSGPGGTAPDTPTGEDSRGFGVTAAHTGGWNSGTMGISLLGTFVSVPPTSTARQALIDHLAWEAERHGLDPLATTTHINPVDGKTKTVANISGHRDWGSTACPGGVLYADLPNIRNEAAAKVGPTPEPLIPQDSRAPRIKKVAADAGKRSAIVTWATNEAADSQVRYKLRGKGWRLSPLKTATVEEHRVRLGRLKKDRAYTYLVRSSDAAGNVSWSRALRFDTAA
jgi:hypothetical protein